MATKKYQITQLQEDQTLLVLHPETEADVVTETTNKQFISKGEKDKLSGIASGAQVNKIEVIKVNGKPVAISNKEVDIPVDYGSYIPSSQKGTANGVASLGSDGKVPSSQLPSYVDDVLEYTNKAGFPAKGETGKIYVANDTNLTYRWSGSAYVEISPSLALGETSSTAYAGNKGKANADAIAGLKTRVTNVETKNGSQDTEIANIKNGTTKVGKATSADSAGSATSAGKLTNARTISLGSDMSGSASFDGSANITINATLKAVGTAGTYTAITTDSKGRVVSGGQILEVGTTSQVTPNKSLAIGGIFFKEI